MEDHLRSALARAQSAILAHGMRKFGDSVTDRVVKKAGRTNTPSFEA